MTSTLFMVLQALAAMVTALATWRRPRVAAAFAAIAAAILFIAAAELAAAGDRIVALAVFLPGGVAGLWAVVQALADAKRRRAEQEQAKQDPEQDPEPAPALVEFWEKHGQYGGYGCSGPVTGQQAELIRLALYANSFPGAALSPVLDLSVLPRLETAEVFDRLREALDDKDEAAAGRALRELCGSVR